MVQLLTFTQLSCSFGFLRISVVRVGAEDIKNTETDLPLLEPLHLFYFSQGSVMSWEWNVNLNLESLLFSAFVSCVH